MSQAQQEQQVTTNTLEDQNITLESDTRYVGQVKWFNNKLGYGFITIRSECERNNQDVFVHQANIKPVHSQYRTLVQGEYVSFNLGTTESDTDHKFQAVDIRGVEGGSLMCDQIRRNNPRFTGGRFNNSDDNEGEGSSPQGAPPRHRNNDNPRRRFPNPRYQNGQSGGEGDVDWQEVRRHRDNRQQQHQPRGRPALDMDE